MGDSTLSGTNKQDQRGNTSERDPMKPQQSVGMQTREGQTGGTNTSQPTNPKSASANAAAGKSGSAGSGQQPKRDEGQESLGANTGEEEIRTINTPPGEPYNDPRVRGH